MVSKLLLYLPEDIGGNRGIICPEELQKPPGIIERVIGCFLWRLHGMKLKVDYILASRVPAVRALV